ncbi:unnamed protein product [Prorocentrum cordatum]|uniref:Mechanosensitive ion channel MscS domain-containing protein n=1 Tax=Prorocentrum cordatum TaxID=2364126 RepID=A0ABN9YB33_9DINO|nr:unnamed protein product [Polarella glacialis]
MWRPSELRIMEKDFLGASAARRAARRRGRAALEAALRPLVAARGAPGPWVDRERASRPTLQRIAAGDRVPGAMRLRRNTAWHACRVPPGGFTAASSADLSWAAAGPRLGHTAGGMRAEATPFVPRAACRAVGVRCNCGTAVWPLPGASPVWPPSEAAMAKAFALIQPPAAQMPCVTESEYCESVDVDLEVAARRVAHPEPLRNAGAAAACGYPGARRMESAEGAVSDGSFAVQGEACVGAVADEFMDAQVSLAPMAGAVRGGKEGEGDGISEAASAAVRAPGGGSGFVQGAVEPKKRRGAFLAVLEREGLTVASFRPCNTADSGSTADSGISADDSNDTTDCSTTADSGSTADSSSTADSDRSATDPSSTTDPGSTADLSGADSSRTTNSGNTTEPTSTTAVPRNRKAHPNRSRGRMASSGEGGSVPSTLMPSGSRKQDALQPEGAVVTLAAAAGVAGEEQQLLQPRDLALAGAGAGPGLRMGPAGIGEALAAAVDEGAALAISPAGARLSSAPSLGWSEYCAESSAWVVREGAGLSEVQDRGAQVPARARLLAASAPPRVSYRYSYFQAFELPGQLWGCCVVAVQILQWLLVRRASTKKLGELVVRMTSRAKWLVTITCMLLCSLALVSRWKERRSRGKAIESDILGSQSSQREARLTAVTIALQALSWIVWLLWVMALLGIDTSRVLLVPSVGAIFLGFLGRDILSNVLSGLVIYLTQPFAQGDWITLEDGQDGWVHEIGIFYTKVVQWDKRPLYVPNIRLIHMLVQNNSRMSHRRIRFDINVRLKDIPKVPAIVNDLQGMLEEHNDLDTIQHRLVRWRQVGDYYATVWLSCYTRSTEEGIRLKHFIAVEQSVLERTAAILYKHGADFATSLERFRSKSTALEAAEATQPARGAAPRSWKGEGEAGDGELRERERVLRESREEALKAKEEKVRLKESGRSTNWSRPSKSGRRSSRRAGGAAPRRRPGARGRPAGGRRGRGTGARPPRRRGGGRGAEGRPRRRRRRGRRAGPRRRQASAGAEREGQGAQKDQVLSKEAEREGQRRKDPELSRGAERDVQGGRDQSPERAVERGAGAGG